MQPDGYTLFADPLQQGYIRTSSVLSCPVSPYGLRGPRMGTRIGLFDAAVNTPTATTTTTITTTNTASMNHRNGHRMFTSAQPRFDAPQRLIDWPRVKPSGSIRAVETRRTKIVPSSIVSDTNRSKPVRAIHLSKTSVDSRKRRTAVLDAVAMTTSNTAAPNLTSAGPGSKSRTPVPSPSRRGIATNPLMRRRLSADAELTTDYDPCPKRQNLDTTPSLSTRGRSSQRHGCDQEAYGNMNAQSAEVTHSLPANRSQASTPVTEDNSTQRLRRSILVRSRSSDPMTNRSNSPLNTPQSPQPQRRRSSLLLELQRSARHTLHSLRNVLRGNSGGGPRAGCLSIPADPQLSTISNENQLNRQSRVSLRTSRSSWSGSEKLRDGSCDNDNNNNSSGNRCFITVQVHRNSLEQPFGLFVIKSTEGFEITRMSKSVSVTLSDRLQSGDRLIAVNGVPCANLSVSAIRHLFSQHTRLTLTIWRRTESQAVT